MFDDDACSQGWGWEGCSVARSGWRFPAQKLTKTRPLQQKLAQNLTAKIMWYDFITMLIKINKDHFHLLKIK